MKKGFYWIMAAQFFSSLADNALLIAAIALLVQLSSPGWMTPLLKFFFTVSYVLLGPFVGGFSDSLQKGHVMLITNLVKLGGLLLMLFGAHPLWAYAVVGLGAAAYSPAKYGILTELLPPQQLVAANGWIEGTTVGSIILGTVLGGFLVSRDAASWLLSLQPLRMLHVDTQAGAALAVIALVYVVAALCNLRIPDTGARYPHQTANPVRQLLEFGQGMRVLWSDRLGQISMAVTTLFWGAGATLQFIVIKWAESALGLDLSNAAVLQATVAFGVALGAMLAASRVPLKNSLRVLPVGMAMGVMCIVVALYTRGVVPDLQFAVGRLHVPLYLLLAGMFMVAIGAMAGYFVVPMNALLQHRGYVLLSAGHSIAVQNFNENLSVLAMLGMYSLLIGWNLSVRTTMLLFGAFIVLSMWLVMRWNAHNMRQRDWTQLIGEARHSAQG